MITKIHNKLVRDKIPQFLKNKNVISIFNKEYNIKLKKRLIEEVNECLQTKNKINQLE